MAVVGSGSGSGSSRSSSSSSSRKKKKNGGRREGGKEGERNDSDEAETRSKRTKEHIPRPEKSDMPAGGQIFI